MSREAVVRLPWAGLLLVLTGCGSEPVTNPRPLATPEVARTFLYLVTAEPGNPTYTVSNRLVTYRIDPGTGAPALSGTPVDFNGRIDTNQIKLTADPAGRLLYVHGGRCVESGTYSWDRLRSYRVEPDGRLTLGGEVPRDKRLAHLAASPSRLYVWSTEPSGTHHSYNILQAYAADSSGALAATPPLIREYDSRPGYSELVGADPGRDLFYFARGWGRFVVAAVPDATAEGGYREIAALDSSQGIGDRRLVAGGFLFARDEKGGLNALVANESTGLFEPRGFAEGLAFPEAFGGGMLAGSRSGWVSTSLAYYGIDACRVSSTGALTVIPGLPVGTFTHVAAMAVHPSGRHLYVAGRLADTAPSAWTPFAGQLALWTVRVDPDAGLTLQDAVLILPELGRFCRQIVVVSVPS